MAIDIELLGIGITLITPIYYYMHKISTNLTKVTTTIDLCPNCPHNTSEDD